jgi:Delta7-sterol 5-desaturase
MQTFQDNWWLIIVVIIVFSAARYFILAGSAYMICYKPGIKRLRKYKIQQEDPAREQMKHELLFSISTIIIFSLMGSCVYLLYTKNATTIYFTVNEHGWTYLFASFFVIILVHDAYFYWVHRLLHTKWFMKNVHFVHHRSINPSPWAAYAFHPVEALFQSFIVIPLVTIFPVHYMVLLLFTVIVLLMNIMGHLGYEFYSKYFFQSWLEKIFTCSTHHNLHHQKTKRNYGYYFTFWDRMMKTYNIKSK